MAVHAYSCPLSLCFTKRGKVQFPDIFHKLPEPFVLPSASLKEDSGKNSVSIFTCAKVKTGNSESTIHKIKYKFFIFLFSAKIERKNLCVKSNSDETANLTDEIKKAEDEINMKKCSYECIKRENR